LAPVLGPLVTGETDARKVQNNIDDAVDGVRRDMESTIRALMAGAARQ
jgi:BMFP domain-containing protein YqiC